MFSPSSVFGGTLAPGVHWDCCVHSHTKAFPGRRALSSQSLTAHQAGYDNGAGGHGPNAVRLTGEEDGGGGSTAFQNGLVAVAGMALMKASLNPAPVTSAEEPKTLSIVVPTLNEESTIEATIQYLLTLNPKPLEIIVVDGGSSDKTIRLAKRAGATVLKSGRGRGRQMNAGAKHAKGEYVCFLHADTVPPKDLVRIADRTLRNPKVVLGGCRLSVEQNGQSFVLADLNSLLKTWYLPLLLRPLSFVRGLRILFGDQALFCRKAEFDCVGGFEEAYPIMEDASLCIAMHMKGTGSRSSRGKVQLVMNRIARTSARRISEWGNIRTLYVYIVVGMNWYLGASPEKIQELYNELYSDSYR